MGSFRERRRGCIYGNRRSMDANRQAQRVQRGASGGRGFDSSRWGSRRVPCKRSPLRRRRKELLRVEDVLRWKEHGVARHYMALEPQVCCTMAKNGRGTQSVKVICMVRNRRQNHKKHRLKACREAWPTPRIKRKAFIFVQRKDTGDVLGTFLLFGHFKDFHLNAL